jgi:hypothetical protein
LGVSEGNTPKHIEGKLVRLNCLIIGTYFNAAKLKKRGKRTHTELKRLMGFIDKAARDKGVLPKEEMTQGEAQHCFSFGLEGIEVSLRTPWQTKRYF